MPASSARPLRVVPPAESDGVFDEIILRAFTPAERPDRAGFAELMADPDVLMLAPASASASASAPDGAAPSLDGIAIGQWTDRAHGVALLAWLAVNPARRGAGIGSALLDGAIAVWESMGARLVLGEIDDPRVHAPHPDFGDPDARIRFYRRHGVRALPMPYFLPTPDQRGVMSPGLFLCAFGGELAAGESLPVTLVRDYLDFMIGDRTATAYHRASFAALGGRETMPLLPLDPFRLPPTIPAGWGA